MVEGEFAYWQCSNPLPPSGSVMVGTRSPSRLGITHNNSHIRYDYCGRSSILAVLGLKTRVLAPGDRSGLSDVGDDAVHDANAQTAVITPGAPKMPLGTHV
jgi:hypothetical protein